jgi:hypothetical protein
MLFKQQARMSHIMCKAAREALMKPMLPWFNLILLTSQMTSLGTMVYLTFFPQKSSFSIFDHMQAFVIHHINDFFSEENSFKKSIYLCV